MRACACGKRSETFSKKWRSHFFDKVSLRFEKNPDTDAAISTFKEYIASQVLADNVVLADSLPESAEILDIDGISLKASIDKIV